MLKWINITLCIFSFPFLSIGQKDTTELQPVKIRSDRISYKTETVSTDSLTSLGANNLSDALTLSNPVFLKSYGPNGVASLSIRGGKPEHSKIYWNDIDLNFPTLGLIDLNLVPISAMDAIEVSYGQSGINAGTGSLGGSVNLSSDFGFIDTFSLQLRTYISSLLNTSEIVKFQHRIKKWKYKIYGQYDAGKNHFTFPNPDLPGQGRDTMRHSDYNRQTVGGQVQYEMKTGNQFKLLGMLTENYRQLPLSTSESAYYGEEISDKLSMVQLAYSGWINRVGLQLSNSLLNNHNQYLNPQIDQISNNDFLSSQSKVQASWESKKVTDKKWRYKFYTESRFHYDQASSDNFSDIITTNRFNNLLKGSVLFKKTFNLTVANRIEWFRNKRSGFLPSASFTYQFQKKSRIHIAISRNLRFPNLNELYWQPGGNPELLPERSGQAEVSLSKQFYVYGQGLYFTATAYHNITDNWITWLPSDAYWQPVNIKTVQSQGIDIKLTHNFDKKHVVSVRNTVQYSYVNAQNLKVYNKDKATENKQVIFVSPHQLLLSSSVSIKKWTIQTLFKYISAYYTTTDNSAYMPSYGYTNLTLSRKINFKRIHLFNVAFTVNNISNYPYQVMPGNPMPGRYYGLNIKYTLKK